ncbi:anaerobic ribonucleoside-triphosphate reductase activating protein, partial [bacterium]|nr:anaerobic ribonucleoside-triphosphate reductase activating protein [bacterium]
MDIKAPLDAKRYGEVIGLKINLSNVKKSIKIIMSSNIDYEFRTTVIPSFLNDNDIKIKPYPEEWFESFSKRIRKNNQNVQLKVS